MSLLKSLRTPILLLGVVTALALGFIIGAMLTNSNPATTADQDASETYTVTSATVAKVVPATVEFSWPASTGIDIPSTGRLTGGLPRSGTIDAGDVVARVNGQPVVAIQGSVPAYRELGPGSKGTDVTQLQRFLANKGFAIKADGDFGPATARAVNAYWRGLGVAAQDRVPLGAVVFLPQLPAQVMSADGLRLGAELVSPAFVQVSGTPRLEIILSNALASSVQQGAAVTVQLADRRVSTRTSGPPVLGSDGILKAALDSHPFHCATTSCPSDLTKPTALQGRITITPMTTGPAVPVSALALDATGAGSVTLADGSTRAVHVRAQADGVAIVDGLDAGTIIRVPKP